MIKCNTWAGEITQQVRARVALPEDLGSISSTHMATHNCLSLHFQGICQIHRHTSRQNTNACKIKVNKSLEKMQYTVYFPVSPCDKYSRDKATAYEESTGQRSSVCPGEPAGWHHNKLFLTILWSLPTSLRTRQLCILTR